MKKLLLLLVIFLLFVSCNDPKEKKLNWDYPDENAEIKTFNTKAIDDKELISRLEEDFRKGKFKIESKEDKREESFSNCNDNLILKIKGNGIRRYYVKRTEAKPKNYYPDFMIFIYEFDSEAEAEDVEEEIREAFYSGNGFCNGKGHDYLVRYKNKVVQLATRAHMFMDYTKEYAEKIKSYR